jgi:hypothetical protein
MQYSFLKRSYQNKVYKTEAPTIESLDNIIVSAPQPQQLQEFVKRDSPIISNDCMDRTALSHLHICAKCRNKLFSKLNFLDRNPSVNMENILIFFAILYLVSVGSFILGRQLR